MTPKITLIGYHLSVYNRIARMTLLQKGARHDLREVDPFEPLPRGYADLHPFGRVPVLLHGDFALYETGAITRYVDRACPGPGLQPGNAVAWARMDQVIAIIDSYGYWPMVRQVFSHGWYMGHTGEDADPGEVAAGLQASGPVLAALDRIAGEGQVLNRAEITLADLHLAPMLDYFVRTDDGARMLRGHPALSAWWDWMEPRDVLRTTDPFQL